MRNVCELTELQVINWTPESSRTVQSECCIALLGRKVSFAGFPISVRKGTSMDGDLQTAIGWQDGTYLDRIHRSLLHDPGPFLLLLATKIINRLLHNAVTE